MAERSPDRVTIKIPRPLYVKIRTLIEGSGFRSPTDFIVFVLRDLVGERAVATSSEHLAPDEIAAIRRRLRALGYIE